MQIDLSKKEFRRLLDMVYIGNWILNSTRGDDRFADYDDLESKLFALCREQGMDTLEANLALGFHGDEREYYLGAQILRELGVKSLRLLTNNPDKVYQLSEFGLEISERVPIQMTATPYDLFYLKTKQARMGHILNFK